VPRSSAFGEQISAVLSAGSDTRAPSLLLPTTRERRGPPKNELHLGHAVAKHHSVNQCVHFLQLGPLGRHFPTEVSHFGPQSLDLISLASP
jgi:hypothetical protein